MTEQKRGGSLLICVVACISIVSSILMGATHSALRARSQVRVERQLRQVELLLEAGVRRAAARAAEQDEYDGETWTLAADAIPEFARGRVDIEVDRSGAQPIVNVAAELSAGSARTIRRSFQFSLP